MNAQNITHDKTAAGLMIRDIRSAPSIAAHGPMVQAEGATLTVTSAEWDAAPEAVAQPGVGGGERRTPSLGERLMERKLVQWTLGYLAMASWVLQLLSVLSESWSWSAPLEQAVSLLLGLGVIPAVVVAWYHGEKGSQKVCTTECALVAASVMASVIVVWSFSLGVGR